MPLKNFFNYINVKSVFLNKTELGYLENPAHVLELCKMSHVFGDPLNGL